MATAKDKTKKEETKAEAPTPVVVDNRTARSDDDARQGFFALVIAGDHTGQNVTFVSPVDVGTDGYPETALIEFRDHAYPERYATVPYEDLRPATSYNGGR